MARILCGISGIEFSCEHLPIYLSSREYAHPIFFLPQKKLLGLYQKYRHSELNEIDSYLLFLSYLNSTDLVEWRVPAQKHPQTALIIANNFEALVNVVERMNTIRNPNVNFSHISVGPETKTLQNVSYWIASWEETYDSYISGYASQKIQVELHDLEEKLEFLIKDVNRCEVKFASRLAEWADKAGNFPKFPVQVGLNTIPCNEYWKQIIRKCVNAESVYLIPSKDIQELLDHCEEYIDAGSIYAFNLFKIIRVGLSKQSNFLGLGDYNFTIINTEDSVEKANKLAIIKSAPTEKPSRLQYPSSFSYLKAKLAWDMAQEDKRKQEAETDQNNNTGEQNETDNL